MLPVWKAAEQYRWEPWDQYPPVAVSSPGELYDFPLPDFGSLSVQKTETQLELHSQLGAGAWPWPGYSTFSADICLGI